MLSKMPSPIAEARAIQEVFKFVGLTKYGPEIQTAESSQPSLSGMPLKEVQSSNKPSPGSPVIDEAYLLPSVLPIEKLDCQVNPGATG